MGETQNIHGFPPKCYKYMYNAINAINKMLLILNNYNFNDVTCCPVLHPLYLPIFCPLSSTTRFIPGNHALILNCMKILLNKKKILKTFVIMLSFVGIFSYLKIGLNKDFPKNGPVKGVEV